MATPSTPLRLSLSTLRVLRQTTAARPFTQAAVRGSLRSSSPQTPTSQPPSLLSHPRINQSSNTSSSHAHRLMHTTPPSPRARRTPLAHNREPVPDRAPPTDFEQMDVLASAPVPTTAVEVSHADGFSLNSGVHIRGGAGALLVAGEAFAWRPWLGGDGGGAGGGRLLNEKGQWEVGEEAFAVLAAVWPRPDLLILGLGPEIRPLSPTTRRAISNLGMRVEVLDTRNAASQYNMLATERGVEDVAAALIPIGWKEGAQ
ncbi:uncharacterized protein B0H64DRAFT_166960 [Chaetomium fimeti]|uniref:NADH dehydrogenase [ubiquinone] 1 alpha subcomplex assembly factor 3 n=1 Tax=Chaetomium fimeti TaxID=1854472 RepID=A0AAE0HHH1_9PEZI|nr:hypothetical protein B0H64DRAFT_166960 [Chaetomium fimeti]